MLSYMQGMKSSIYLRIKIRKITYRKERYFQALKFAFMWDQNSAIHVKTLINL